MKLTLLAASPMYYQLPIYRILANTPDLDFHVVYASNAGVRSHDAGFGEDISWDVPLLDGYSSEFLAKADTNPIPAIARDIKDWDVAEVIDRRRGTWWLHGYNTVTHGIARAAIARHRLPWVLREEQNLLSPRSAGRQLAKSLLLPLFLSGAEAAYLGEQNRLWLKRYGVPDDRLHWAPYAVDNESFQASAQKLTPNRPKLRSDRSYFDDEVVLLSTIRLVPKKQPLALIMAAAQAMESAPNLKLRIVGNGSLMPDAVGLVERLHLKDRITFAGFVGQAEIAEEYTAADAFVLFSGYDETWGLVVNEAMNFGLPVIASDRVGSAFDLVVDDVTGFRVAHDRPAELAAAMVKLAADATLRSRLGAAGRERIDRYSPQAAAAGILNAARAATERKR